MRSGTYLRWVHSRGLRERGHFDVWKWHVARRKTAKQAGEARDAGALHLIELVCNNVQLSQP